MLLPVSTRIIKALGGRLQGELRPAGIGDRGVAAVEEPLQPGHGRDVGHLVQGRCGVLHGGKPLLRQPSDRPLASVCATEGGEKRIGIPESGA